VLAKKKKLSKKQIKEDSLVKYYSKSLELFEEYKQQFMIAGAVIVIIIAAIYIYNNKMEENQISATTELSRVLPIYEQKNYLEAIEGQPGTSSIGLKTIVEEYGSSQAGEVAKIYLGNANYYLGNYDEALEYYSDYSGDQKEFKAAALAGQAACYVSKEEYGNAASTYEKAAGVSEFNANNPSYLLQAGNMYLKINDLQSAKKLFAKIKQDYKTSTEARNIDRYLMEVEIKSDVTS